MCRAKLSWYILNQIYSLITIEHNFNTNQGLFQPFQRESLPIKFAACTLRKAQELYMEAIFVSFCRVWERGLVGNFTTKFLHTDSKTWIRDSSVGQKVLTIAISSNCIQDQCFLNVKDACTINLCRPNHRIFHIHIYTYICTCPIY